MVAEMWFFSEIIRDLSGLLAFCFSSLNLVVARSWSVITAAMGSIKFPFTEKSSGETVALSKISDEDDEEKDDTLSRV